MVNPKLLRSILFGVWSVDAATQAASLPILSKLLKGEAVDFYDVPKSEFMPYSVTVVDSYDVKYDSVQPNSIFVTPIKGMITKEDQSCGPSGTLTLMRTMQQADNNPNVLAHILDIDSGGGEATNIASVAEFIRGQISKPVFAWYNGLNASAAYGISCAADEIFAAQDTDIIGSIGVFVTVANWKKYYASQGLDITDIYSKYSTDKNALFQKAIDGDTEPLQKSLLDPFAETFFKSVKTMRPNVDDSVFTGGTYMATEAKKKGLIDGKKSWAEILQYAEKQGLNHRKTFNKNKNRKTTNMNFGKKVAAFLGFSALEKDQNGNVSLNEEAIGKLDAHFEASEGMETKLQAAIDTKFTKMENTLNQKINAFELQQTKMQETVDAVADLAPAAKAISGEENTPLGNEQYMTAFEKELQSKADARKAK